jgi:hypothetical protein
MATAQGAAVLVADDHGNEAVFPSLHAGVDGIRAWFNDALGAYLLGDTIGAAGVANVAAFAQDPRALASALTCFDPRELAVARWLSLAQSGRG